MLLVLFQVLYFDPYQIYVYISFERLIYNSTNLELGANLEFKLSLSIIYSYLLIWFFFYDIVSAIQCMILFSKRCFGIHEFILFSFYLDFILSPKLSLTPFTFLIVKHKFIFLTTFFSRKVIIY